MTTFYIGLTPWLAFIVADRSAGLGPSHAALMGLLVAVGIIAFEFRDRRLRPLPFIAAAEFSVLAALSAHDGGAEIWRYDRAIAVGFLAAAFIVSSFLAPPTAPYVRDVVPPRFWTDRRFFHANATLTRAWALALILVTTSFTLGATFESPFTTTMLNWLVPILIVAVAGARLTPPSEDTGPAVAMRALDSIMSDSRDAQTRRKSLRRLGS